MSIFDDIASGADRLRRGEDALIWRMRGEGKQWAEVEAEILARRERARLAGMRIAGLRALEHWRRARARA